MASSPPWVPPHEGAPGAGPILVAPVRCEPLLDRLLALLELGPDDLLVQLGCAFPDRLLALTELVPLRYQALVVHSSPEGLAPFAGRATVRLVAMAPLRFAAYPMQCDRILLDDTLLGCEPSTALARGLFTRLRPAGRLLAVGAARQPELSIRRGVRAPAAPRSASAQRVARALVGAGFEVTRDAANLESARIDLILGVKPAAS